MDSELAGTANGLPQGARAPGTAFALQQLQTQTLEQRCQAPDTLQQQPQQDLLQRLATVNSPDGRGGRPAAIEACRYSRLSRSVSLAWEHEQLTRRRWASSLSRQASCGSEPDSGGEGHCQTEKQHSGTELFCAYETPYSRTDIPFEPSRTLDVDAATWRYYTEEGRFRPSGWLGHCCAGLGAYCPGRSARHGRETQQRRQQQQEQKAGQEGEDLERQQKAAPPGEEEEEEQQQRYRHCHRSLLGLPILSPEAKAVHVWAGIMSLLDLTYTAYLVPLSLAFDNMESARFTWFNAANIVGTAFYLVDILIGFHTGFVLTYDVKSALVMEGRMVADYYIRHGSFWLDCIASLPIVPELVLTSVPTDTTAYKWFYMLRLLRLARVFALLKVWGGAVFTNAVCRWLLRHMSTATLYLLNLVLALSLLVNLMGCIWWFLAELEGLENSWVAHTDFQHSLLDSSDASRWVASVYFAMTTMTTVGYGDITPVTPAEQLVAIAFMAFAVFYFGFIVNFVGDLIHGSSHKVRQAEVLRHRLEDVESWMQGRHMPAAMQAKVRQYYLQVWAQHAGIDESSYFNDLPVELRGEIVGGLAGGSLHQSRMFKLLDDQTRAQLASVALPVRLVAGHNLFEEGEAADSFYVLQEGEAAALRGTHRIRALRGPALVGQAAVFSHYVEECRWRLHTVRAVTNCTLWEFRGAHLAKMLKHSPGFLPPICDSYLQYLEDLRRRIEGCGQKVPKRICRIERNIHALRAKVTAKLQRRRQSSVDSMASTPLPSAPAASPPGSPRAGPHVAPVDAAAGDGTGGGGQAWQGLAPPSIASASCTSEAAPEDEQLPEAVDGWPAAAAAPLALPGSLGGLSAARRGGPPFQPSLIIPEEAGAGRVAASSSGAAAGRAEAAVVQEGESGVEEEVPEEEQLSP